MEYSQYESAIGLMGLELYRPNNICALDGKESEL